MGTKYALRPVRAIIEAWFSYLSVVNFNSILPIFSSSDLLPGLKAAKCVLSPSLGVKYMDLFFRGPCILNLSPTWVEEAPLSVLKVILPSPWGVLHLPARAIRLLSFSGVGLVPLFLLRVLLPSCGVFFCTVTLGRRLMLYFLSPLGVSTALYLVVWDRCSLSGACSSILMVLERASFYPLPTNIEWFVIFLRSLCCYNGHTPGTYRCTVDFLTLGGNSRRVLGGIVGYSDYFLKLIVVRSSNSDGKIGR